MTAATAAAAVLPARGLAAAPRPDRAALAEPLARLGTVGLDALVATAALQTRVDRKYLVPLDAVEALLRGLPTDARVLRIGDLRVFDYESVYFDTPDLLAYRLAAHRRRQRFKVRTRTYVDSAACWLEVKTRGSRGTTVKERVEHALEHRADVAPGRAFVCATLTARGVVGADDLVLAPVLVTRYARATLLLPGTASRLTVDVDLTWDDGRTPLHLRRLAVVETKSGSTASAADRALWSLGHRPVRISKYATGLATLRRELPATRWSRTLHRHLLPHATPPDPR
ncbi:polyphosphate polymerase domain-containing protein [Cellulomonas shaoxiangyii]|uniref:polyphosphate polymerase domain-containing protein n=1 Tax=Cellulomonas shaoxiangyii TaxID=2566013 RepID=UPI001FB85352|nr:polyphosphate polymerase domain-containing protein [Cellulomonas shaoxiangyii]